MSGNISRTHATPVARKMLGYLEPVLWSLASIAIFVGFWELAWWRGWANPLLLPPPHIFLANLPDQFRFFDPGGTRAGALSSGGSIFSVLGVIAWSSIRVTAGLALGFALSLAVGLAIRYFRIFGKLILPLITMLAPISPVAWLHLRHRQPAGDLSGLHRCLLHHDVGDVVADR